MPKPTIVDYTTIFNADIVQPLCDLAWDVFGHPTEDRPVNTVDEARELLLNSVYPVGSIYLSLSPQDANGFLPGTWVKLAEGTFLAAAGGGEYALGTDGGTSQVILTEAQMPSHTHTPLIGDAFATNRSGAGWQENPVGGNLELLGGGTTSATGGSQPHENRPPYLAVNMWHRIA